MAQLRRPLRTLPAWLVQALVPIYLLAIFGLPTAAIGVAFEATRSVIVELLVLVAGPLAYAALFAAVAGGLSRFHVPAIVKGHFPRSIDHPVYGHRRLYGLCWTSLYYFKPVYFLVLSIPALKTMTFRLFGYRGSMDFTVYPDTWIRDLPILDFGPGVYLANRATLGTNMPLSDGTILVSPITLGAGSVLGHLAELGPGVTIAEGSEIGTRSAIGVACRIGRGVSIAPDVSLEHSVRVGDGARIRACARVGLNSVVGPGDIVEFGEVVPQRRGEGPGNIVAQLRA
ncbi:hypothetical protein Rumeso_03038 [Rubellimicrobium mesophilum DSM 19309]|uniref:Uncharacterized protein n=1 Tax=Rubellimicrobium mesophilum DSM 19309 TaxID=442562 RepID=A0A017HM08_9RHOB|nr:hypothetical protein [Rubellimicrobium mesophilum]EYD75391.1 hypothetical protein Rumeso_03038 [Rubellimicrobium mesophilum DSM 19309]